MNNNCMPPQYLLDISKLSSALQYCMGEARKGNLLLASDVQFLFREAQRLGVFFNEEVFSTLNSALNKDLPPINVLKDSNAKPKMAPPQKASQANGCQGYASQGASDAASRAD